MIRLDLSMSYDALAPEPDHPRNTPAASGGEMPAPSIAVRVGKILNGAALPKPLEKARALAKKLTWTALEASRVTTPLRYASNELLRPAAVTAQYTLRKSGQRFVVRHRTGDIDIFRKFYGYNYYEWPAPVRERLAALGRPVNTLDLGGNIGFFEVHARTQMEIGEVTAFEPDPSNGDMFERAREANGANWKLIRACASNQDGVVRFRTGAQNFSRIEEDGDFTVPMQDVFPYLAEADLVKMNIEGSEWEILDDPRLAETDNVWIIEYHRIRNPEDDIEAVARRQLERHGYRTSIAMSHSGNGLLWAWREAPEGAAERA